MPKDFSGLFGYLSRHYAGFVPELGDDELARFFDLLRVHPRPLLPHAGREYRSYIYEVLHFAVQTPKLWPHFAEYLDLDLGGRVSTSALDRYLAVTLRRAGHLPRLQIENSLTQANKLARQLKQYAVAHEGDAGRSGDAGHLSYGISYSMPDPLAGSGRAISVPTVDAPLRADGPPIAHAKPPAAPVPVRTKAARDFIVTGTRVVDGQPVDDEIETVLPLSSYLLRFFVSAPSRNNFARGETSVGAIPPEGLATRWLVTSRNVRFVASGSTCTIRHDGELWQAGFDLLVPGAGDSEIRTLAIETGERVGELRIAIYAVRTTASSGERSEELYRELVVDLAKGVDFSRDATLVAAAHTLVRTTHEWTTPTVHAQVRIDSGYSWITMVRGAGIKDYGGDKEAWHATGTRIGGLIDNLRVALENLRDQWSSLLNDLPPADVAGRLARWNGALYGFRTDGWNPLPNDADGPHRSAFDAMAASPEWHALAISGYALFDATVPRDSRLRDMLEHLAPGSRVDFLWTDSSGAGWVPHVPWALMVLDPPDVTGRIRPDPERFLGLRYRIGAYAWSVNAPSRALGDPNTTHRLNLLYWGDKTGDEVGTEARWQANEFGSSSLAQFIPDANQPNPKQQVVLALDTPTPPPVGVLYLYCHASVGNGSEPILRFGNTSGINDVITHNELSFKAFSNGPFIFANACTTTVSDPHKTGLLEDIFFRRGAGAFMGTEAKVPVQLASRFAWLFFRFFYRQVDSDPMAAGEALTQTRMFLWTQFRNVGGLFYSLVNQFDLYLASHDEVVRLRQ